MPNDDLSQYASSETDFYALLGAAPGQELSEKEINKLYRKATLKCHPDKNPDDPEAAEKFHLLGIAKDVLLDPAVRGLYDNARTAREQKAKANAQLNAKRRKMMADLEAAERGAKRKRGEEVDAEEKLQRELKRLAQDGLRRRREREEKLERERAEEERRESEKNRRKSAAHVFSATKDDLRPSTSQGAGMDAATPRKSSAQQFPGLQSAPSTPAGRFKPPAFSFSPKPSSGSSSSSNFEQSVLARLKAKQEEKRKLEQQIRTEEAEGAT
ncbi:DnaJ-domain-containing protein [Saccharata proteae CBS 121410]|uniref:DnaJ-domain-containing protein n=1 Tax=Saccharata proteae CBS 121410 TaxID=1314787 RepID=A0A9P4HXP0_9PEZI|nr:DnaJ-domain-containing protein [Saccharata proteae CBS 121410]